MKRCPTCAAVSATEDRFCEADGAPLVDEGAQPSGRLCSTCRQGTIEADGFCSACGRRATGPPPSMLLASGQSFAGFVVKRSRASDDYHVAGPGGTLCILALGERSAIEHEAEILHLLRGEAPFPRLLSSGVDPDRGAFLVVAMPSDAQSLIQRGASLELGAALSLVRDVVLQARAVERFGFAWEPLRDDFHVRGDGGLQLSRMRVPRRLVSGEPLDGRAVIEALGPTLSPEPLGQGPPRAMRLLLPHVAIPGDSGSTIDDVLRELDIVDRDIDAPDDDGTHVAGVCDPGLRRPHNEDAFAKASGVFQGERWTVLVVCDGVSSSSHADQASAVASRTARSALSHFARSGDLAFESPTAAVSAAIRAAHLAVCTHGIEVVGDDPPGTTIVVAFVWRRRVTIGWVGDSRAYWVSNQGSELLTEDHSWANEARATGRATEEEIKLSPLAHALTRCLGPLDAASGDDSTDTRPKAQAVTSDVVADIRTRDLPGPGWLVLCSDGLWNYVPSAGELWSVLQEAGEGASPARIARRLVTYALSCGGQDNTTVLLYEHR